MIKQLGLPCFFETFSYAESYWDDLRQILSNYEPELKNANLPKKLYLKLMKDTSNKHVAIVNAFFVQKFELY